MDDKTHEALGRMLCDLEAGLYDLGQSGRLHGVFIPIEYKQPLIEALNELFDKPHIASDTLERPA